MFDTPTEPHPYRVLALDGGGVRGLYTAVLLAGIAERFARRAGKPEKRLDIGKLFDLIVGTSTGAILACALAAGVPIEDLIALYRTKAAGIFQNPTPEGTASLLRWVAGSAFSSANKTAPLRAALETILRTESMAELYARRRIGLCVPSVNAETLNAWVFKTPHDTRTDRLHRDDRYTLVDVCLASSAAPIILPLACIPKPEDTAGQVNWFVDGGIWANNPGVVALVEAVSMAPPGVPIQIVSVSTCPPTKGAQLAGNDAERGVLGWRAGIKILETSLDAQSFATDYMARTLARALANVEFIRLRDPVVSAVEEPRLTLDNASPDRLSRLVTLANQAVDLNISDATTGTPPPKILLAQIFDGIEPLPEPEKEK